MKDVFSHKDFTAAASNTLKYSQNTLHASSSWFRFWVYSEALQCNCNFFHCSSSGLSLPAAYAVHRPK